MLQQIKEGVRDWLLSDADKQHLTDISLEYSYHDLASGTGGFASSSKLGSGAAGTVYRGTLRGGTEVAVKRLPDDGTLGGFEDEVRVLSRFRHPNLVTLLGWGQSSTEKFLVYELLTGGDVGARLAKCRDRGEPFEWRHRLRVGADAACGLSHMMNSTPKALHRDIKPANILLDANGTAKMADFGLAGTIRDVRQQHLTVENISGTPGYACPVYMRTGHVNEQTEAYSFGVVLLELLLNMPPALQGPSGDIVYPLLQAVMPGAPDATGRVLESLDRRAAWPRPAAEHFASMALSCIDGAPERRPPFEQLVRELRALAASAGAAAASAGDGAQGRSRSKTPPAPEDAAQASEVALSCVHADGVDLAALPAAQRCLAFPAPAARGAWSAAVGRQHQPELFDRLVLNKELLSCISRSHFELLVGAEGARRPLLRKLSANPLLVQGRLVAQGATVELQDGARVGFSADSASQFLVFELAQRLAWPRGARPQPQGGDPYAGAGVPAPCCAPAAAVHGGAAAGVAAVLECVQAAGCDLSTLSPEERAVPLPLEEAVEVGRQQHLGFFERLLQGEPQWLAFISRAHLRVRASRPPSSAGAPASGVRLQVENLSSNPVLVSGQPLGRGHASMLPEGGSLAFVALGRDGAETQFLELVLRRARGCRG